MVLEIFLNCRLYRSGNKEILLFEPQLFAGNMIIIWIKNFTQLTCKILLFHSLLIISLVKGIQLKTLYGFRIPYPKRIHHPISVSHNRKIIRNRMHLLITFLPETGSAMFILISRDISPEFDHFGIFGSSEFKRISVFKPVIGHFYLIAFAYLLPEHTIPVSDSTAIRHIAKCRK